MGQPGFFDLQRRYEGLDAKRDPLVAILAAVPFELFRGKLKTALVGIAPMNRDSGQWRGRPQRRQRGVGRQRLSQPSDRGQARRARHDEPHPPARKGNQKIGQPA